MGEASDSIFLPLVGKYHCAIFFIKMDSQFAHKMPDFGIYTIRIVIGMMHCTNQQPLNMNCFKLVYTNKTYGSASNSICLPPMGHTVPISINIYSQIARKCQIFDTMPSQWGKWCVVSQGETTIAHEVFQNLPYTHRVHLRFSWYHLRATCGSHCTISIDIDSLIAVKMLDLGTNWACQMRCYTTRSQSIEYEVFQNLF